MKDESKMLVVDCFVAISWFMPDENSTISSLERVANYGAIVPSIWELEVANVLLTACRRNRVTKKQLSDILEELNNLNITVEGKINQTTYRRIIEMAEQYNLTSYDASYLELAKRYRLPLATLDKKLIEACALAGVKLN
jgi:predicted nucleic acid-binding protein